MKTPSSSTDSNKWTPIHQVCENNPLPLTIKDSNNDANEDVATTKERLETNKKRALDSILRSKLSRQLNWSLNNTNPEYRQCQSHRYASPQSIIVAWWTLRVHDTTARHITFPNTEHQSLLSLLLISRFDQQLTWRADLSITFRQKWYTFPWLHEFMEFIALGLLVPRLQLRILPFLIA